MTSTLLSYQLYARNLPQSLKQVAAEPENKSDQAYFDANIGKVKTVDDFIKNYRLFSYAMKAYGLDDLTYAKALIKKVLTSDLSDSHSVANKLSDPRYKAFAQAFNFTTTGAVKVTSIQSTAQQSATTAGFKANELGLTNAQVDAETAYYTSHIGAVTSMAGLEKDLRLYSYVMTANRVDPGTSRAAVEQAVEGSLSDPNSTLNTGPGAGYLALNQAFNVDAAGVVTATKQVAQTSDQTSSTVTAYAQSVGSGTVSQNTAKVNTAYFSASIENIKTVDDLVGDQRLVDYVVQAYGLPVTTTPTMLKEILTSDVSDPKSAMNQFGDPGSVQAARDFNFASDGSLKVTKTIQNTAQQKATVSLYTGRFSTDTPALDAATAYYKANIGSVGSVSALEKDSQLYDYVLKAYGVDPGTPKATVEKILEQTAAATSSVVSKTDGSRDLALHMAFTVDAKGNAANVLQAQTALSLSSTVTAYTNAAAGTAKASDTAAKTAAKVETSYYKTAIAKVNTVGDLLGDSRLVNYVIKAFGLPKSTTTDTLRQVLTSDLTSKTSKANVLGGAFLQVAQAFTFNAGGMLTHQTVQTAQDGNQVRTTDENFNETALENEAGQQNPGVQLALYFRRKAPTITDGYAVLADKALTQVFQTYLGLPASTSNTNLDKQAAYIKSKINFADLKDPAKLNKMVMGFAARYDIANPGTTQSDTISALFGSNSDSGDSSATTIAPISH